MSKLVEELKQNIPFSTIEEEVFLNLQKTAYELRQLTDALLKEHRLTQQQYNVLRILRGSGENGLAFSEISARMLYRDSDITRLIDRLAKSSLVSIERLESDRRVKIASITETGLELLNDLDEPVTENAVVQLEHLGPEMLQQLNALLVLARTRT